MIKTLTKCFAAVLLVAGSACAPSLAITTYQPAKYNLGKANSLSIVQSEGRRSAKEYVIAEIQKQARAGGRFTVSDRTEEGITVKIMGRSVQVSGGKGDAQQPTEVGLRVDVMEWGASKDSKTSTDSKGNQHTTTTYAGKVVLSVTAFNPSGKAILAETEYVGKMNDNDSEDRAAQASAVQAVTAMLRDITPVPVRRSVRLDDSDEAQKPIIEVARNGSLAQAITDINAYIAKAPTSAAAHFNLAVFLDASGSYDEALTAYDKAIQLGAKDFYTESRTACAKRAADAKALQE